ncbi:sterile alpha motif domain-containing protein 15-like [Anneissia japonica]|uniref:sterile alpha motif domain-containing protein 15-like n=1 Tax=Anneissia japonica TaxID=1529436 RepID=UPI0014259753|nr:sterile alpha motif domain-containing protein 15-like [Anneissia japonica]
MAPKCNQEPVCLTWSYSDVSSWIEGLGFPEYAACFETNLINGRKLILMDASNLPKIGITDFEHIKFIAKSVRDILEIEQPYWNRSISLEPRERMGMFLERKRITGPIANNLTYAKYIKEVERIEREKARKK